MGKRKKKFLGNFSEILGVIVFYTIHFYGIY